MKFVPYSITTPVLSNDKRTDLTEITCKYNLNNDIYNGRCATFILAA